ncbi:MAG TPA: hypothetical protein VK609_09565, partial [Mucilaginibacter sp.]|nr:hypothetical protein [Mucilaginibacter sp.]
MMLMKKFALSLLTACLLLCSSIHAQTNANNIRVTLQSPYFEKLYANTYYSLLDRMGKDGFLPESLTGAYEGMYCRTTGALVSLFLETGQLKEAELNIQCVLNATTQYDMERIPHV